MTTSNIQLPFGIKGGTLIHISDAQRGRACACTCPSCGELLVARKGPVTAHHFAHDKGTQCEHAVETALHLACKQLLSQRREITLPAVEIPFNSYRSSLQVAPAKKYKLDKVQEEQRTGDIIPDLIAFIGDTPLFIEIHVTHAVDEVKVLKIRSLGISAIEVDFSRASRDFSPGPLADALIDQTANKTWLYNAKVEALKGRLLQTGECKKIIERGLALHVDDCPISARTWRGKSYANFIDDCAFCEFCFHVADNNESIVCGGRNKITTLQQLRNFQA